MKGCEFGCKVRLLGSKGFNSQTRSQHSLVVLLNSAQISLIMKENQVEDSIFSNLNIHFTET